MLSPRGPGPRSQPPRALRRHTRRQRFAFGGVAFELLSDDRVAPALDPETGRFCVGLSEQPPTLAELLCAVQGDLSLPPSVASDRVAFERGVEAVTVSSQQLRAQLRRLAPGRYAAAARVASGSTQALQSLLRALSAAVVELEGGLTLHAAGLELDGEAVLFVGPSTAGKSTAITLSPGGRCFAYDHVVVHDTREGPCAWGLPGGTPADAARAATPVLPLRGIYRVRQAPDVARIQPCDAAESLFVLRESVESADDSATGEDARLSTALSLSGRVQVAVIHTVLGASLTPLLRQSTSDWSSPR